jgi:3',5'-cyclic AMP phosphodiesterase CpdA
MRLIHLTDPHLSSLASCRFLSLRGKRKSGYLSWYKNRRHVHLPEILEKLTHAVKAESPDQILVTGDLVHIGLEKEVVEAIGWLQRLGAPDRVMLIPGNHDLYAEDSESSIQKYWGEYLPDNGYPYTRDLPGVRLLGINSSIVTPVFSAAGKVGPKQLAAIPQCLSRERFNVMLIHHPPLPGMTRKRKALRDAAALENCFASHAPDLLLHGHIHTNRASHTQNMKIFCTASASSRDNASFRVFDISGEENRWTVQMQLKTLGVHPDKPGRFAVVRQEQWLVQR